MSRAKRRKRPRRVDVKVLREDIRADLANGRPQPRTPKPRGR